MKVTIVKEVTMRRIGVVLISLAAVGLAFGQQHPAYWSLGGYGSVLYPGTGHATGVAPPANYGNTGYYTTGYAGHNGSYGYPSAAPRYSHPNHARSVIVPYPVFVGGGYYGGYAPDQYATPPPQDYPTQYINPNGPPSVIINQGYVPEHANPVVREYGPDLQPPPDQSGIKLYQSPSNPYANQQKDPQPTIYLLAFKDHNIIPALGYWMEGSTLHYVSVEHSMNQASLDLIDRDLSQRLNDERGVE